MIATAMRTCSVDGCGLAMRARGLCSNHWRRERKYGDPAITLARGYQRPEGDPAGRLAAKTVRSATGCDEWMGSRNPAGYGLLGVNYKVLLTHRIAYELAHGSIPEGMHVLHHCDNPPCHRTESDEQFPDGHLFVGTDADNHADRASKGRPVGGAARTTRLP